MASRHRFRMDAAIDRLEQVREELACAPRQYRVIVLPEIERVLRKKQKIVRKFYLNKRRPRMSRNEQ
jgi:hypothetical protein